MASRKSPPEPPTDNEWERRSLEGTDPESGMVRHQSRLLAAEAPTLLEMAESHKKWAVFRSFVKRFAFVTAALVAALSAFKDEILNLLKGGGQ